MKKASLPLAARLGVTLIEAMVALAIFGIIAFAFAAGSIQLQKVSYRTLTATIIDTLMQGYINEVWAWPDEKIEDILKAASFPTELGSTQMVRREDKPHSAKLIIEDPKFTITRVGDGATFPRRESVTAFDEIKRVPLMQRVEISGTAPTSISEWSTLTLHTKWLIELTAAPVEGYLISAEYYYLDATRPGVDDDDRKIKRILSVFRAKQS